MALFLDILGRYETFVEIGFQPALVQYERILLFNAKYPNNVLSPGSYKIRSGPGVSGVRFQQPILTRCLGAAYEMDFLSSLLAFSCNQIGVQVSEFGIY